MQVSCKFRAVRLRVEAVMKYPHSHVNLQHRQGYILRLIRICAIVFCLPSLLACLSLCISALFPLASRYVRFSPADSLDTRHFYMGPRGCCGRRSASPVTLLSWSRSSGVSRLNHRNHIKVATSNVEAAAVT
ncbi:unnamed protein product [Somion occarium]|uniref:Transmembrane protein n=1 Tax=Somion occarium TaxID=3059160 RepID=A0ABP1D3K2_9APHY